MSGISVDNKDRTSKRQKREEPLCWICHKGDQFDEEEDEEDEDEEEYDERTSLVEGCPCRGAAFQHFHIKCYADMCVGKNGEVLDGLAGNKTSSDRSMIELRRPWVVCLECGEPWESEEWCGTAERLSRACCDRYGNLPSSDLRHKVSSHISGRVEFGYFHEAKEHCKKRAEMNRLAIESLPLAVLSAKAPTSDGGGCSADAASLVSIPDAKHVVDIVSYLDVPGLNSMMRTSKAFHAYIRSDGVWEPHLKQMLGRVFDTLVGEGEEEKAFTKHSTWKDSSSFLNWADEMLSFSHQPVLGHLRCLEWNSWDLLGDFETLWYFCNGRGEFLSLKYSDWLMHDVPLIEYYKGAGYFASSGLVRYLEEEMEENIEMAASTNRCENCGLKVWWGDHSKCKPRIPTVKRQRKKSFGPDLCRIKVFVMKQK